LAFRTHHSVMDARGTLIWAEDIFRALNGAPVLGSYSTINDLDLDLNYIKKQSRTKLLDSIAPAGVAQDNKKGFVWIRKELAGRYPNLIAQIALLLAREAWAYSEGNVTIGIPVDWRMLNADLRTTANLSVAVTIPVERGTTQQEFTDKMRKQIIERVRGSNSVFNRLLQYTPIWLIGGLLEMMINRMNRTGRYSFTGIITGARGLSLEGLKGGGFVSKSLFFVPPYIGSIPFFIAFEDYGKAIQLVATAPIAFENSGRFEFLMEKIVSGLVRADK
jgi:hypothetical protein